MAKHYLFAVKHNTVLDARTLIMCGHFIFIVLSQWTEQARTVTQVFITQGNNGFKIEL